MNDPNFHPDADRALDWVQGFGTEEERAAFVQGLADQADYLQMVDGLAEGAAILAMSVPQIAPPAGLRNRSMERIDQAPQSGFPELKVLSKPSELDTKKTSMSSGGRIREVLAWAAAIAFAAGCAWLWQGKSGAEVNLAEAIGRIEGLDGELAEARKHRDLARFEVESLKATIDEYQEGVALVVWDAEKQEGILKLEKMPPIPVDKDYQLWVVDPDHESPVDAGVVRVDEQGFARVNFKPSASIAKADKFAISVERRGGVAMNEGPIVLLSP